MIDAVKVHAAGLLHHQLAGWKDADEALSRAASAFKSNTDRQSVLVKASAVDKLYSTRVNRIYAVADHVVDRMGQLHAGEWSPLDRVEFVHELAKVPNSKCKNGYELLTSFASKYSHFFISAEEAGVGPFPIYDSYAAKALLRLAGKGGDLSQRRRPYADFCELLEACATDEERWGCRDVDRFLWLSGQYLAYAEGKTAQLNGDVVRLFMSDDLRVQEWIAEMIA